MKSTIVVKTKSKVYVADVESVSTALTMTKFVSSLVLQGVKDIVSVSFSVNEGQGFITYKGNLISLS